jgi:hypothetical protein
MFPVTVKETVMSSLRKQMQADMVIRGLAPRTQTAYIDAVAGIARHYHRSPDQLSIEEIHAYLHHLIDQRKRSWSTGWRVSILDAAPIARAACCKSWM